MKSLNQVKIPPRYKPKTKKKIEFSKKWLIACVVISIFYTSLSCLFAWFDKNTVEALSIQIIETLWGATGISFAGYALQNCCRAYTTSKFGIPRENQNIKHNAEEIIEDCEE